MADKFEMGKLLGKVKENATSDLREEISELKQRVSFLEEQLENLINEKQ